MLVLESHASSTEAFAKTIILVTVWTFCCVPVPALCPVKSCCKKECVFGYRAVLGRLLQTLCDELGSDVPTWQIVDKRVHQSHTSCIPPSLRRAFTHLGTEFSHT